MVQFAVNSTVKEASAGALDKLILALQFYNTFADEPVLIRPELVSEDQIITKFFKFETAQWPGSENLADFVWTDEEGVTHLRSTNDDVAQVSLSSNGF